MIVQIPLSPQHHWAPEQDWQVGQYERADLQLHADSQPAHLSTFTLLSPLPFASTVHHITLFLEQKRKFVVVVVNDDWGC